MGKANLKRKVAIMDGNFIKRQYEKDETFRLKSFKGSKLTGYLKFQIALENVDKKLDLDTAAKITKLSKGKDKCLSGRGC